MKVTLLQLVNSTTQGQDGFSTFSRFFSIPLPSNIALELRLLSNQIQEQLKAFNTVKDDLIVRLGTPLNDGSGQYKFNKENAEKYNKEMNSLLEVEKTFDFNKIAFSLLEGCRISGSDLEILSWLIDFEK